MQMNGGQCLERRRTRTGVTDPLQVRVNVDDVRITTCIHSYGEEPTF